MSLTDYSRFILSADQRQRVADIVDSDDESMFLQIEEILSDYNGNKQVLDDLPKAWKARDAFAAISRYAKEGNTYMLKKKINALHRWTWIEYLFTHINYKDLEELSEQAADMAQRYDGRPTPRNKKQIRNARDFALYDLVDVFTQYMETDFLIDGELDTEWLDTCEVFITEILGFSGIDTPAASDPDMVARGEQHQGRLRRLIKSYLSSNSPK